MQTDIKNIEDVLEYLEKSEVTFVNLWFADILGQLKSFKRLQGGGGRGSGRRHGI